MKTYYEIFRDLREDNDKTQKEIAQVLGIDQSYYSKYEKGKREMPIRHIVKLCNYYKVSSDYILGLPKGLKHPER